MLVHSLRSRGMLSSLDGKRKQAVGPPQHYEGGYLVQQPPIDPHAPSGQQVMMGPAHEGAAEHWRFQGTYFSVHFHLFTICCAPYPFPPLYLRADL